MTCRAVRQAVLKAVSASPREQTAHEVWAQVRWWHPDTITEALVRLARETAILGPGRLGTDRYCRIDLSQPVQ